jgi:hypothetical protein
MPKLVNISGRTRTIFDVTSTSKSVGFTEDHGHGATATIRNDSDRTVMIAVGKTSATAEFTTDGVQKSGTPVLAGATEAFNIDSENRYIAAIHESSGGTGDVHVTISREGGA